MAEKRNGEVESTQGLVTAEKGGLVPGKLQRRDFGKLLGVHTLLSVSYTHLTLPTKA